MDDQLKEARRKVVGTKQTIKALEKGEALRVYVAGDADEKVIRPVVSLCEEKEIEPYYVDSMGELGKMCGIKVKAAAAAVTED